MSNLDRRRFLTRSAVTLGAVGTGAVLLPGQGGAAAGNNGPGAPADVALGDKVAFDGAKQAGILDPPQAHCIVAALDAVAPDASSLGNALQALSYRARELAVGGPVQTLPPDDPSPDSGTLGDTISPDGLTVTVSFGAGLFDDRYGLAAKKPAKLTVMPRFAVDENLDPSRTGGDVLLQICAGQRDTVTHTLRELMRLVRGSLELRWVMHGFQSAPRGPSKKSSGRNLFAFRDGTANPDVTDSKLMDQLVWANDGEPTWATGGTYQVVRTIRMQVEFWDRVGVREQENMIGRSRSTGAPLGGTDEFEDPRLDLDPKGERIPMDAHIRLANPRTDATADQKILRRGYNYDRGFDEAGALDQGLIFIAYNQDPVRQFATIQNRLNDEPMTDYIRPVGGGYFFAPPGTGGPRGWIGQSLFS